MSTRALIKEIQIVIISEDDSRDLKLTFQFEVQEPNGYASEINIQNATGLQLLLPMSS